MNRCRLCGGPCEYTPPEPAPGIMGGRLPGGWSCEDPDCDGSWNGEACDEHHEPDTTYELNGG